MLDGNKKRLLWEGKGLFDLEVFGKGGVPYLR
jgi:hypothetical protein